MPTEVQNLLRRFGYRGRTVWVSPSKVDVITELPPVRADLTNVLKPRETAYAVSPSGETVQANNNRVFGEWPRYREEVAPTIPLPAERGPWSIVRLVPNWDGKVRMVYVQHGKLDSRYAQQRQQLTGLAAAMLYVYGRTRGAYRKRSLQKMKAYEKRVGPVWNIVRDELLEKGLIVLQRSGEIRVTSRGQEVVSHIPYSYDPDNWVHEDGHRWESNSDPHSHVPPEGLFGGPGLDSLGAHIQYQPTEERVSHGR